MSGPGVYNGTRDDVMADRPVILYTLEGCDVSDQARAGLTSRGILFEEREVTARPEWWEEAQDLSDAVPIIIYPDGRVESGWEGEKG